MENEITELLETMFALRGRKFITEKLLFEKQIGKKRKNFGNLLKASNRFYSDEDSKLQLELIDVG